MLKKIHVLVIIGFLVSSCASVPITDRTQLHLIPSGDLMQMSYSNYEKMKEKKEIIKGTGQSRMVKRVGNRIRKGVENYLREIGEAERIEDFDWEFTLFKEDQVNAWCMPGGKVGIYTGILDVTQNESGLAVVMSHEIAHAVAAHGNERMSQRMLVQFGGVALSVALAEKPAETQNLFMAVYGLGATVGFVLPYSRLHESEADRLGLIFMAVAGYNPHEAVDFWERMEQMGKSADVPVFLRTHPTHEERIENIKDHMPDAMEYYRKYNPL
jgi:predicted Zn-dependent protease